jgi:hypothetical protein
LSKATKKPVELSDRRGSPRTDIGKLSGITGIDYDMVRRRAKEVKARWAEDIADVGLLRSQLFQMASDIYQKTDNAAEQMDPSKRAAMYKVQISIIQAMLDVTGLRTIRVDVQSSQFERILNQLATISYPAGGSTIPALPQEQVDAIDGEWKKLTEGKSPVEEPSEPEKVAD